MDKENKIKKVIIFGGTHGNELSGVFLLNKWMKHKDEIQSRLSSCDIDLYIANPEAVRLCTRYKDCDLNRQFSIETVKRTIQNPNSQSYEESRAAELYQKINGAPESEKPQVLLDLHNTTSNMGCTIIIENPDDMFSLHHAAYIKSFFENEKCRCEILTLGKFAYGSSRSLAHHGLGLEVGPQPHGVLRADILQIQQKAIFHALDFVQKYNDGVRFPAIKIKTFSLYRKLPFPKKQSPQTVMIHEDIQDKDYQSSTLSTPVFRTMDNKTLCIKDVLEEEKEEEDKVYPVFINEAAYYEKDLACWLTKEEYIDLPPLAADK